ALAEVTCIDDSKLRILFDTGPSPVALMHNVKNLKVDLTKVDTIVLSHGHWDHVGGLKEAIKMINKRIKLICHPQALQKKILVEKGEEIDIGITEYIDSIEDLKSSVELVTTTDSYHINEVIITTGEIPRINSFEKITGQLRNVSTFKNDMKVKDEIEDDLSSCY
ncbi:MAG: MBL fold metallo-hydrolase, partial [Candidatus Hodarchaeales archaeon]